MAEFSAVQAIRGLFIEMDVAAGFAAYDTAMYGPTAAIANLYTGAIVGAALPFARIIARPLGEFAAFAAEALPGGLASLARIQLRSRVLAQPYKMLLVTMELAGIKGYQGGHLMPAGVFKMIPRSHGLAIPMEGTTSIAYSQHWRFHRSLEIAWDRTRRLFGRNPTVGEYFDFILPDALQNADLDPATALILSEECEKQAIHFGYKGTDVLENLFRNTKQ